MLGLMSAIVLNVTGIAKAQPMPKPIVAPKLLVRPSNKGEAQSFYHAGSQGPQMEPERINGQGVQQKGYG